MSDFDTKENDRRVGLVIEMGVVEQVRYSNPPQARVRIGDLLTGWLRMGTMRAGGDKDWAVCEVGEEVLIACTSGELRNGVIVCAIFNGQNPANASSADICRTDYGNGSFVEHNRATGKLTVSATGDIDLLAGGNIKINGARIDLN